MNLDKVNCFKYLDTNVQKIVGSSCHPSPFVIDDSFKLIQSLQGAFPHLGGRPWLLPDLNREFCSLCQERKSCLCDIENQFADTVGRCICGQGVGVCGGHCSQFIPPPLRRSSSLWAGSEGKAGFLLLWPQKCMVLCKCSILHF